MSAERGLRASNCFVHCKCSSDGVRCSIALLDWKERNPREEQNDLKREESPVTTAVSDQHPAHICAVTQSLLAF